MAHIFYDEYQDIEQPALIYIGISNSPLWRKLNITINTLSEIYPDINFYIADINYFKPKKYNVEEVPAILFKINDKSSHYRGYMIDVNELSEFIQKELSNVVDDESDQTNKTEGEL